MKKISAKDISVEFVVKIKIPELKDPIEIHPPLNSAWISFPLVSRKEGLRTMKISTQILQEAIWKKCIKELAWWRE